MMKTKIDSLWQKLRDDPIDDGGFKLRRLNSESPHHISAGMDATGKLMFAVEVDSHPPEIDIDTKALEYFRLQRKSGKWLMVLRLYGEGLELVFGRLCQDLADEADQVVTQAKLMALFQQRLLLWKKLFQSGRGNLEKYQIKGLIAELLALRSMAGTNVEKLKEAVFAWVGPLKRDQDFIYPDHAIEIKAVSPSTDRVSISSEDQLDTSMPLELWVYVLRDTPTSDNDAICIINLVAELESVLATAGHETLSRFKSLLLEAGYVEQECYETYCFNLMNINRYEIADAFPRLMRASVPDGVTNVSYSVELSAIQPFLVGSSA